MTHNLGAVTSNQTVVSTGALNVVSMTSLAYNSNVLTLQGRSGQQDFFVIRVGGTFDFAQSQVNLVNTTAKRVVFYFPNGYNVKLYKAENIFRGTILSPNGSVEYHNPADFKGAIIARNINLHSYFNLDAVTFDTAGIPVSGPVFNNPPTGKLTIARNLVLNGTTTPVGYQITR